MKKADRAIITSGLVVAASTAGLPAVRGYGTVIFQLVMGAAWSIVARLSSGIFADRHQGIVWLVNNRGKHRGVLSHRHPFMAALSKPFAEVANTHHRLLDGFLCDHAVYLIPGD